MLAIQALLEAISTKEVLAKCRTTIYTQLIETFNTYTHN